MNLREQARLEEQLRGAGRHLLYPAPPDVSSAVRGALERGRPRARPAFLLRVGIAIAGLIALVVLTVPPARALVAGWFRIGVITIVPQAPELAVTPQVQLTPTTASLQLPGMVRDLSGRTTLMEAQQQSGFQIRLPAVPQDLGAPDAVFYQPRLTMAVLVWFNPSDTERVRLSLYEFLSSNPIAHKVEPTVLEETSVNGHPALWLQGPYPLEVRSGDIKWMQMVEGRSLVWESNGVTFRLETELPLEEAIRVAESVK